MTIRYSASTKGFYPVSIDYPDLPDDLVEITEEEHHLLMEQLSVGGKQIINQNGKLVVVDAPRPPVTWEDIRAKRDSILQQSDYTQLLDWPGDKNAWAVYRQALRDLPQDYIYANRVIWPTSPA
jgi:hypothetical protein